jgi:hypothetical protein
MDVVHRIRVARAIVDEDRSRTAGAVPYLVPSEGVVRDLDVGRVGDDDPGPPGAGTIRVPTVVADRVVLDQGVVALKSVARDLPDDAASTVANELGTPDDEGDVIAMITPDTVPVSGRSSRHP